MAKKRSSNAVEKIDGQIKELVAMNKFYEGDNGSNLEKEKLIKKKKDNASKEKSKDCVSRESETSKKKASTKKSAVKVNGTVKKSSGVRTNKEKSAKKTKTKVSEDTLKINKLEEEIRGLYSFNNDLSSDLKFEKTIVSTNDAFIADVDLKDNVLVSRLDRVSISLLNRLLIICFAVFMVLFTAFIGLVIFVSTF